MELKAIGVVRNAVPGDRYGRWEGVVSEIRLLPDLEEAAEGLEGFSHLVVLFWLDRARAPTEPRIHPEDREDLPLVGYLATRTPNRPNPIALSTPRLLERRGSVLVVQGLDAFDGSPVLDVKPYMPMDDEEVRVPDWSRRLGEERRTRRKAGQNPSP